MRVNFPWDKTPIGGWFFVPTLTPEETRAAGLQAAIHYRIFGIETKGKSLEQIDRELAAGAAD